MKFDYDFFVIGAGSGGVRASRIASTLGAKVAVAEDTYLGGTCVNAGCVPKKLMVYSSQAPEMIKLANGYGWNSSDGTFDWVGFKDKLNSELGRLNNIYRDILTMAGVSIYEGHAKIIEPHVIDLDGKRITADKILIATGGWPRMPEFPGGEHCFTSNDMFSLDKLPESILIQGGGYISVEFAGIMNGLGVETEIVNRGRGLLKSFDKEVADFTLAQMHTKGIAMTMEADIESVEKQGDGKLKVSLNNGETRMVDAVLSAIGRVPNTKNLGLENTEIKLQNNGTIPVDENFQTAQAGVYAIGDVVGRMELTPVALEEGMALAKSLFSDGDISIDYDNIPTAIFCQPNIGTVGLSEEVARARNIDIDVYKSNFRAMKTAFAGVEERCLFKLIVAKKTDRVIGCHIVAPDAGEILQGFAVAINAGATKADFDKTIGIHPTIAEELVTMRTPV